MDEIISVLDDWFFDKFYASFQGQKSVISFLFSQLNNLLFSRPNTWPRDDWMRQYVACFLLLGVGGSFFYLLFSCLSWIFIFDKKLRKHPKFLPNQEQQVFSNIKENSLHFTNVGNFRWFSFYSNYGCSFSFYSFRRNSRLQ